MSLSHVELPDHVFDHINSVLKYKIIDKIIIGYSGGLDSTVLLHIVAGLRERFQSVLALAIHVNHGLNPAADSWADQCQSFCKELNLELKVKNYSLIEVKTNREAAYRQARYAAFAAESSANSLLLTAHHQHDQVETVLFNLFRGAGVSGLKGMQPLREFLGGCHLRPLLSIAPDNLLEYARYHNLPWIDDPSNKNQDFDRNYIRHVLLPVIKQRWPSALASITRSADLLEQSELILNEIAMQDVTQAETRNFPGVIKNFYLSVLNKTHFNSLSYPRKCNALRFWLKSHALVIVNSSQTDQIIQDLCELDKKSGLFEIEDHQICAYKNFIYLIPKLILDPEVINQPQKIDKKTYLLEDLNLILCFNRKVAGNIKFKLRDKGERVQVHGQTKILKKLYQDLEIPPWERRILPLVYLDDKLVTIAGTKTHPDFTCTVSKIMPS